jgi:hypothetical protein
VPNSVAVLGNFEFVSVQTTGQIFTYDISSGVQAQVGAPYATPCDDPSGMAIATIGAADVMAVVCYDTGSLLTLNVDADGSLRALGSVGGLSNPYPGLVLDGTNVLVPLFGKSGATNGGVAKVSLLDPAHPVVAATATLASPVPGGFANPGYLLASGGYIYVAAGSESAPLDASSTIQVVEEATMTLVGQPLVVPHSPQQIAIQGTVAYVTLLDAAALEAIDISNPANLQALQTVSFSAVSAGCHPEPVTVQGSFVYVGCYYEGILYRLNVSGLLNPQTTLSLTGIAAPQRLVFASDRLLVPSSSNGGSVYQIALSAF